MKFKAYDVIEVISPQWHKDETGNWTFPQKLVKRCDTLKEAQRLHAELTIAEDFPTVEDCHKYVINGVPQ